MKKLQAFLVISLAVFIGLVYTFPLDFLITLLNGAFVGTMLSVTVAYGGLFWDAFFKENRNGKVIQPDVRQFALAFLGAWFAYGLSVGSSVYLRAADLPTISLVTTALSRYVAILAAIGQITAPGYGEPFWQGIDRKILFAAMGVGLVVGAATVVFQETNALAINMEPIVSWHG